MVMLGWSANVTTLFMGRLRPPKQLTSTKLHILLPVTLLESAEEDMKVSDRTVRTGYQTSDLWLLSQTLSMMVYAKFKYLLNVLFCEYKQKLNMYYVPELCTMLSFTNFGPLKCSTDLAY